MSIILAFIVFSILVLFHEFGHFLLAKKNGIGVIEFSLGMGPRIVSFVKGETRYSWKWVPFGGSCMMADEYFMDMEDYEGDPSKSFNSKSVWARISVVAAGPIFNFILAFVFAILVISFGGIDIPHVASVEEGGIAAEAGLQEGDVIVKYNKNNISLSREISLEQYFEPMSEKPINLVVKRDNKKVDVQITPEVRDVYMLGMFYSTTQTAVEIVEDGAMSKAGMKTGDKIVSINDTQITNGGELSDYIKDAKIGSETLNITYDRDGKLSTAEVIPTKQKQYDTGFGYSTAREEIKGINVIKYSAIEVGYNIENVFKSLKFLVTGKMTKDDLSGPVGIVDIISTTVERGKEDGILTMLLSVVSLTILLSANLGVMNLLPIPAVDGGRLVFLFLEAVRGKPIAREKEGFVHMVGMILLMLLMVFVLYNDIMRIILK